MISATNGWRRKTINKKRLSRSGFTLMEVMVAMAIFSMTVTVVFVIFANSIDQRRAGEGYGTAVSLVDTFLAKRKLNRDGADWFFSRSVSRDIREGRIPDPDSAPGDPRMIAVTNGNRVYTMRLRGQVLEKSPLIYRAFVDCRWMVNREGKEIERNYAVSTVFAHPIPGSTRR